MPVGACFMPSLYRGCGLNHHPPGTRGRRYIPHVTAKHALHIYNGAYKGYQGCSRAYGESSRVVLRTALLPHVHLLPADQRFVRGQPQKQLHMASSEEASSRMGATNALSHTPGYKPFSLFRRIARPALDHSLPLLCDVEYTPSDNVS